MDEKGIVYEHTINYYETDRMGIVRILVSFKTLQINSLDILF